MGNAIEEELRCVNFLAELGKSLGRLIGLLEVSEAERISIIVQGNASRRVLATRQTDKIKQFQL